MSPSSVSDPNPRGEEKECPTGDKDGKRKVAAVNDFEVLEKEEGVSSNYGGSCGIFPGGHGR